MNVITNITYNLLLWAKRLIIGEIVYRFFVKSFVCRVLSILKRCGMWIAYAYSVFQKVRLRVSKAVSPFRRGQFVFQIRTAVWQNGR